MKQKEIEEKNKENEAKLKEIEKREIEIEGKIKEYEVKLKQIELKNKFIIIKENEIDEKNKEYENIIKKIDEKENEIEIIKKEIDENNKIYEIKLKEIDEAKAKEKEIEEIKKEINKKSIEIDNKEKEFDEKRKEIEAKIKEIEEKIKQETENNGFDNDMNNCNKKEIPGGIIKYLTNKCGGNVDEKGVVNVSGSSLYKPDPPTKWPPKRAAEIDITDSSYISGNLPNSWLKYDFIGSKVRPTHYLIRSKHDLLKGCCHLKTWVIEGSNSDQENDWKILDTRSDITYLGDYGASYKFEIQQSLQQNEYFRYLRIRQTGPNTRNDNYLVISALEYFGSIINA